MRRINLAVKGLTWLWVLPLLLLVALLAAPRLNNAIWVDEFWTYYTGGGSYYGPLTPYGLIERLISEDPWNVPGFFATMNAWALFVGWTPLAMRTLGLLCGLLAVAWTYRLGRAVGGARAGLGAALALALSAFFIHYTSEMRNYALLPPIAAFVTYAYWRISHRPKVSRALQIGFVLAAAVLPYLQYFGVLPLIGLALYHLTQALRRVDGQPAYRTLRWWRVPLLLTISALLFLPWALLATLPILGRVALSGHLSPHLTLADFPGTLLAFANGSAGLLLLVAFFLMPQKNRPHRGVFFAVFVTLTALSAAFLINQWRPILLYYRYLIAVWPLLALCAGLGLARLAAAGVRLPLALAAWGVAGALAVFSPTFMDAYQNPLINAQPWNRLVPALQQRAQPGDAAAFHLPDRVWWVWQQFSADYYFHGLPYPYRLFDSFPGVPDTQYFQVAQDYLRQSAAPRLWNIYPAAQRPDGLREFERALSADYAACDAPAEIAGYRFDLYTRADIPPTLFFGAARSIGLRLALPLPAEARDTLTVMVGIRVGADVPPETYSLGLHVLDSSGTLVAQADFGLPYGGFHCRQAQIALAGLPSGSYTLTGTAYAWQTLAPLPAFGANAASGERLPLGTFRVS
ncbi:MAG: glycosyltransferase family 39 protein [Chloroflexi bacterium]|nr:glycosyltransferase family 39 protein [Chloroflexota bacterium]